MSSTAELLQAERQEIIDRDEGYQDWIEYVAAGDLTKPYEPPGSSPATKADLRAEIKAQGGDTRGFDV